MEFTLLQSRLLQNAVQSSRREVVSRSARNGHEPGLGRMLELAVRAALANDGSTKEWSRVGDHEREWLRVRHSQIQLGEYVEELVPLSPGVAPRPPSRALG